MSDYNGWTNWHTWNANLHLTNQEHTYRLLKACKNPIAVEYLWDAFFEGTDEIETNQINFLEIFEASQEIV